MGFNETYEVWDDAFEENDWFDEASFLQQDSFYEDLTAIDWDTYYFYTEVGDQITITLDYLFLEGDLDLYLIYYDESEDPNTAWILDQSTTSSNQEKIVFIPDTGGYYYFLVYNNEINMHYNLTLSRETISASSSSSSSSSSSGSESAGTTTRDLLSDEETLLLISTIVGITIAGTVAVVITILIIRRRRIY